MSEQGFPVTITPEAVTQAKSLLSRKGGEGSFLRVGVKGGGCSGLEYVIRIDSNSRPNDYVVDLDGVRFACDPKSATFLHGATLQYTGNLMGGGFAFDNPNAKRSCGCGTSFTPAAKTAT